MRPFCLLIASGLALFAAAGLAPQSSDGPYHIIKTQKVGGDGNFDYVYADPGGRAIYIARSGPVSRVNVFNIDTLEPMGEISKTRAHGAVVDPRSHHGFCSSKPVAMWDSKTMAPIKTIDVDGSPDGILGDPASQQVYILSHSAPNVTVIDAKSGTVVGTIDVGGAPEQSAVDGKGHLFVDLEDKGAVAVVDTKTLKVTNTFPLGDKFGGNAGMAFDVRNHVLFIACREPSVMVMMDSNTGAILGNLPIGAGCDGAGFNPRTNECFSSQGDGTLTVIKEESPTKFVVEQTVKTMPGAKTMTIDSKTGKVYLISAEYGPVPDAPAANGRRPRRGPMLPGSFSIIEVGK
jgi:YVTN family beta-propeller protein